jgi:hypothetical protein
VGLGDRGARGDSAGQMVPGVRRHTRTDPRAGSICVAMSASWCLTAWNCAIDGSELLARLRVSTVSARGATRRRTHRRRAARAPRRARARRRRRAGEQLRGRRVERERGDRTRAVGAALVLDAQPAAPRSTSAKRPPRTPTTTSSASAACGTWRFAPCRSRLAGELPRLGIPDVADSANATVAIRSPDARSGSQRRCCSLPASWIARHASAWPRIGPAARRRRAPPSRARARAGRGRRRRTLGTR